MYGFESETGELGCGNVVLNLVKVTKKYREFFSLNKYISRH